MDELIISHYFQNLYLEFLAHGKMNRMRCFYHEYQQILHYTNFGEFHLPS